MNKLNKQIESAKLARARMADAAPYMFNEWCLLKEAEHNLEQAQKEYNAKLEAWRRITGAEDAMGGSDETD